MNRKVLNKRLAAGLFAVIVVVTGGVHLFHGKQVRRSADAFLAQSDRAEKGGRFGQAVDYLVRYLVYRPTDVNALVHYAKLLEGEGPDEDARLKIVGVYQKALRLAPERAEIRRKLAELLVDQGDYGEAKLHAEALVGADPKDGRAKLLLGRCEEGLGRAPEAAAAYDEARQLDPAQVEAYVRLAVLLRGQVKDPDRADAVMDAKGEKEGLVAANPKSALAYLERASYRERYAVPGVDPAADVAKALSLAPDDAAVLMAAARVALAKADVEGARKHLTHSVETHPEVTALYQTLAELEREAGKVDEAARWLLRGVDALSQSRGEERAILHWMLADMLIKAGRTDEAAEVIKTLGGEGVRPELLEFLEATNLAARGKFAPAARALRDVHPALEARPEFKGLAKRSLLLLGRCYELLGNADQRLDAYRRAVSIEVEPDPLRTAARFGLASALVAMDKVDEALDVYRRIPGDANARVAAARLQILQNFRRPEDQRHWDEVGRSLDVVEQGLAGRRDAERITAQVTTLRAEALAAQGRLDQARDLLEKAVAKQPEQVDLWVALANLAGRGEKPEAALAVLDDARKRLGDRIELRLARIGYWARRGGDGAPAALANLEADAKAFNDEDLASLRRDLALAYAQIGKADEAARLWTLLAAQQPDDLNVRLTLFDLALRSGDAKAAPEALDQIRRVEGEDGSYWRFGQALLRIAAVRANPKDRAPLAEARADLEKVALQRPSWSRVPLALAEVDQLDDRPDAAIRHLLRAVMELGDRSPSAIRRTAQLLSERQRYTEAELVLGKLRDDRVPLSGELRRLSAQVAFRNQDYSGALERAEQVVSDRSDDYRDLIWLGQLRWAAGQPAEPAFRRAVALAGQAPDAWLALILYLAGTNRKADATEALAKAEASLPRAPSLLALAQACEAIEQPDRAAALYAEALKARPDDLATLRGVATFQLRSDRPAEAEPHLKRIIDLGGATTDAAWARRVLASVLAAQGGHRRTLQALEILGLSGKDAGGPEADSAAPEDVHARARLLSLQPSRVRRREAIALLERLADRRLAKPEDILLLAQLDEADGDWPRARQRLLGLVGDRAAGPESLAAFIRAVLRHGGIAEAQATLARLEKLVPEQPATVELKARVLHAGGRDAEASSLLTKFADADDARLEPVALLCEELSLLPAAESLYRRSLDKTADRRPAVILGFARFLGRRGRVAEALDLIDSRAGKVLPAEKVTGAAIALLYNAGASTPSLQERVSHQLEGATKANPGSISIRFDLSNLRILQGRFDEAESILRDVHERNKSLGAPLNNLAYVLALRGRDPAGASRSIGAAIELEGEMPDLLDTRALVQLAQNRPDLAIRDLEDAIAVEPAGDKYFHLARAYLAADRRNDAADAFAKAKKSGLDVASLHPLEQDTFRQLTAEFAGR